MKKNALSKNGLSLSEAQSISNLCHQRALSIDNQLKNINSCTKTISISGNYYEIQKGIVLPSDIILLLLEKGKLHACQAFLMENMKAKEQIINNLQKAKVDLSKIDKPKYPDEEDCKYFPLIDEEWGWEQLTVEELEEFYENESLSAHIGKFIHKGSILEKLRNDTDTLPNIEWKEVEVGKQSPITIQPTHNSIYLLEIHEELAKLHKKYESRVNYFKAKVKNLVLLENGRIAKLNGIELNRINTINKELTSKYQEDYREYNRKCNEFSSNFEEGRSERLKDVVSLRISIPQRFQSVIDQFKSE